MAHGEVQSTKPESAIANVRLQSGDTSPALRDTLTSLPNISAEALPLPRPAPKQGSAILTFAVTPLPVPVQVVAAVEVIDELSRGEADSRIAEPASGRDHPPC